MKILILDIETTSLDADRGHILCACAKWFGEKKIHTWRLDETKNYGKTAQSFQNDSEIVKGLKRLAEDADALVAYYGGYGRFDIPFINARLIANGEEPLPPCTVIDPHKTAKSKLKLHRNSLGAVGDAFRLTKNKIHIPWITWLNAQYGDTKAMDTLLKYNVQDVLALEELYEKIRPLISDHPHVARHVTGNDPRNQCTACGSYASQSRGARRTRLFEVYRRACSACGSFFESHRVKLRK